MSFDNLAVPQSVVDEEENRRRMEQARAAAAAASAAAPKPAPEPEAPKPAPPAQPSPPSPESPPSPQETVETPETEETPPEEPAQPEAGTGRPDYEEGWEYREERRPGEDDWSVTRRHNMTDVTSELAMIAQASAKSADVDRVFRSAPGLGGRSAADVFDWFTKRGDRFLDRGDESAQKAYKAIERATDSLYKQLGGKIEDFWIGDRRVVSDSMKSGTLRDEDDFKEWQDWQSRQTERAKKIASEIDFLKQNHDRTIIGRMLWHERHDEDWDDPRYGYGGASLNKLEAAMTKGGIFQRGNLRAQQALDDIEGAIHERWQKERGERGVWRAAADQFRGGLIELGTMGANLANLVSTGGSGEDYRRRVLEIQGIEELTSATTPTTVDFNELSFLRPGQALGWMFQQAARLGPQMIAQALVGVATGGAGNLAAAGGRVGVAGLKFGGLAKTAAGAEKIRRFASRAGSVSSMIAMDLGDLSGTMGQNAVAHGEDLDLAELALVAVPFIGLDSLGGMQRGIRRMAGRASGEKIAAELRRGAQLHTGRGFWADLARGGGEVLKGMGSEGATEAGQDWLPRFGEWFKHGTLALKGQGEESFDLWDAAVQSFETFCAAAASGGLGTVGSYTPKIGAYWQQKRDFERSAKIADKQFGWQAGTAARAVREGKEIDLTAFANGYGASLAQAFRDLALSEKTAKLDSLDVTMLGNAIIASQTIHDLAASGRTLAGAISNAQRGLLTPKTDKDGKPTGEFYSLEELLDFQESNKRALENARTAREYYRSNLGENAAGILSAFDGKLHGMTLDEGVKMQRERVAGGARMDGVRLEGFDQPVAQGVDEDTDLVTTVYRESADDESAHQLQIEEIWDPNTDEKVYRVKNLKSGARPADSASEFSSRDFKGGEKAAFNAALDYAGKLADWSAVASASNESFDRALDAYVEANYPGRKAIAASSAEEALDRIEKLGLQPNQADLEDIQDMFEGGGESAMTFSSGGMPFTVVVRERNATPATLASTLDHETFHADFAAHVLSLQENKPLLAELGIKDNDAFWTPDNVQRRIRVALLGLDRDGNGNPLSEEAVRMAMMDDKAQEREEEIFAYATESTVETLGGGPSWVSKLVHPKRAAKMRALRQAHPELMKAAGEYVAMKLGAYTRDLTADVGSDIALGLGASDDEIGDYIYRTRKAGKNFYVPNPNSEAEDFGAGALAANPVTTPPRTPAVAAQGPAGAEPAAQAQPTFSSREEIVEAIGAQDKALDQLNADPNADPQTLAAARQNLEILNKQLDAWDEEHPAEGTKLAPEGTKPEEKGTKPEEKPAAQPTEGEGKPATNPEGTEEKPAPAEPTEPKPAEKPASAARFVEGDRGRVSMKSPDRSESFDARVAFVDLGKIVYDRSPGFRKGLQNRGDEPGRYETEKKIGNAPDADTLTNAGTMIDEGTPVLSSDLQTVAGNTRMRGLVLAARLGRLDGYLERVRREAERLGVDLSGMETPIMVRILSDEYSEEQQEHIAEVSNRQSKNRVSSENLALDDAKKILSGKPVAGSASMLDLFSPGPDGQLDNAANRDFMFAFVNQTGDNMLMGKDESGRPVPNAEAYARAQRALVAAVLHGEGSDRAETGRLLGFLFGDAGMKRIASGLAAAAPSLVRAFDRNPSFSLREDLRVALSEIAAAKERGESLAGHFAQGEMFPVEGAQGTGAEAPALVRSIAAAIDERARSGRRVRELLQGYADRIFKPRRGIQPEWLLQAEGEENIFGERSKNTKEGVWNNTVSAEAKNDEGLGLSTGRARNGATPSAEDRGVSTARARNGASLSRESDRVLNALRPLLRGFRVVVASDPVAAAREKRANFGIEGNDGVRENAAAAMRGNGRIVAQGDTNADVVAIIDATPEFSFSTEQSDALKSAREAYAKKPTYREGDNLATAILREPGRKSVTLKNGDTFNLTTDGVARALAHMDARKGAVREARIDFIRNVVDFAENAVDFYEESRDGLDLLTIVGRGIYNGRNYYGTVTLQKEEDDTYTLRDVNAVLRGHASGHQEGHGGTVSSLDSSRATNTRDSADSASANRRPLGRVNTRILLQWVLENQEESPDGFHEHFFGPSFGINQVNDASGSSTRNLGAYDTATGTVFLSPDATPETVAHEILGHAVWSWSREGAPELHKKMRQFAAEAPQSVRDYVMRNYPELDRSGEAFMDELCARAIEEDQEIGKMLKTTAEKSWWQRVVDAVKSLWRSFRGANGMGDYSALEPKAAVHAMVKDALAGRTFGEAPAESDGAIRESRSTARARGGSFYAGSLFPNTPGENARADAAIVFDQRHIMARISGLVPGYDYKPEHIEEWQYVLKGHEAMKNDPGVCDEIEKLVGEKRPPALSPDKQYVLYCMAYDAEKILEGAIEQRKFLEKTLAGPGQLTAAREWEEAALNRAVTMNLLAQRVGSELGRALAFRQVAYRWNKMLTYGGLMRDFRRTLDEKARGTFGFGIGIDPDKAGVTADDEKWMRDFFARVRELDAQYRDAKSQAEARSTMQDLARYLAAARKAIVKKFQHPLGKPSPAKEFDYGAEIEKARSHATELFGVFPEELPASHEERLALAGNIVKIVGNAILARSVKENRTLSATDFSRELYKECDGIFRPLGLRASAREFNDAFSDYGLVREATKNEIARKRIQVNQCLRLLSQIEDLRKGEAPRRTGQQRVDGTDELTLLEKQLHSALKGLSPELDAALKRGAGEPLENFVKTPLQIWRDAAHKELRMLEAAVAAGVPIDHAKYPLLLGPEDLKLKDKVAAARERYREFFEKPKTEKEKVDAYMRFLVGREARLQAELEEARKGNFTHPDKTSAEWRENVAKNDNRVQSLLREIQAVKEAIQFERDEAGDTLSTRNKRIGAVLRGIQRSMENMEAWIENPDLYFTAKERHKATQEDVENDPKVKEARNKQRDLVEEWKEAREKRAYEKLNKLGKTMAAVGSASDFMKLLLASGDLSILGVQCATLGVRNPKTAAQAIQIGALAAFADREAIKAWERGELGDWSGEGANKLSKAAAAALRKYDELVAKNPFFREAKDEYGLHLSATDRNGTFDTSEEGFARSYATKRALAFAEKKFGKVGRKLNRYLEGSELAFAIPADIMRITLCKQLADACEAAHGKLTLDEKKYIGRMVNALSGRGDFFGHNSWTATLSKFMWAPARFSGQLQTLALPLTMWAHKEVSMGVKMALVKNLVAPAIARFGIAVALAAVLRGMLGFGDDDGEEDGPLMELDPRSSKFGRINVAGRLFSLTGGLESYITLAARMATGKTKTKNGDIQTLEQQRTARTDLVWRMLRGKAVPHWGLAAQLLDGKTITGQKIEGWLGENGRLSFIVGNTVCPLSLYDVGKAAFGGQHHANIRERAFLAGIAVLGYNSSDFGYNDYDTYAHRFDRAHKALKEAKTPEERQRVMESELGPYAALDAQGEALRHERRQIDNALRTERDPDRRAALLARKDRNEIRFLALWREGLREEAESWTPDMDEALKRASKEISRMPAEKDEPAPLNYW